MNDIRYPIGKFEMRMSLDDAERQELIRQIADAPAKMRAAVTGLSDMQLNTPYRPDGWTIRQVVHHVPDSHLNAYIRFKLTMTEQEPTVKTYHENLWAELHDARTSPIEQSLTLLESLHARWVTFLRSMPPADFERRFHHPDHGPLPLNMLVALYGWHGRHHVAHITSLRERRGWK